MKHERFIAWCLATPWALMPERMAAYASVLAHKYGNVAVQAGHKGDWHDASVAEANAASSRGSGRRSGAIAVIPVHGTIVQRASQIDICEGGTSTQQVSAALREALADETVSQILLDIDSPGGSVYGVQELANEIAQAKKPVVAIANSLAASAAYWIGCAASEFYVTPGGEVGSIGVWMAHQDWSKALDEMGVKHTMISAGKYKVEGNPYQPLAEEAQQFMQSRVDDYYGAFTKGVAKGRKVSIEKVRNGMGQGRVFGADQSLAESMIDGIMTFDEVVKKMSKSMRSGGGSNAELPVPEVQAEAEPVIPQPEPVSAARAAARRRALEIASL